jgi:hypothetical protein
MDQEYTLSCTHCYKDKFVLKDADDFPKAEIKYYTDTPLKFNEKPIIM